MAWFRDQVNSGNNFICAKISEDVEVIDMSTVCHAADESQNLEELSWKPIGKNDYGYQYRGTFDGNRKTITNLYINASQNNVGLFGYTMEGTIKNLTFEYANVTNTKTYTGILVGYANNSNLQNIKISNTCQIKGGKETGGIAGDFWGNAYNCVNYATVQGKEKVGGLFGSYQKTGNSITACANYGNVTATSQSVGGLVGDFSSGTIQDCANYGNVKGANSVAGMAGFVDKGKIQNVFSYGSISATNGTEVGMVLGYSKYGATEGMVAYYSGAKLTANSQEITVKAFGSGNLSEDNATGFTETQLKSGVVAYLLQQNASSEAKWGQNLANNGDSYPVIGSKHQVYADNLTLNCKTYKVVKGSLTNNPTSSAIRYQHGQTINHHVATNATCTEAATKEYWQCQDCQRIFSDSQLTKELTDVTDAEHPALGHTNNEDGYCDRCQHYVAVKPSEENGVYQIAKPCHLAWFRDYVNGTIVDEGEVAGTTHPSASAMLIADIDLTNYCHAAEDGKELLSWIPVGNLDNPWKGNMDGQAHTISHLYIKTTQNDVGLFGCIEDATIQDLIFDNAKVENVNTTGTNTPYTGILAGYAYGDSPSHIKGIKTTNNCTVIGQDETGGIVGDTQINLENCENHSSVKGTRCVGGIVGYSLDTNIKRCTNYGTVVSDNNYIGGIIGDAQFASIEDCANYGKISSTGWYTGGIAGQTMFSSSIQNVFSYGDMTYTYDDSGIIIGYIYDKGTQPAKGIVAYNKEALLNNSSENIPIVGNGSLTFEDGKEEADVVKAFTKQQIKSGEVAYLLNGSTSEGELAWYQKLGTDAYPVLTAAEGNTVYNGSFRYCDNTTSSYSNSSSDSELIHVASATLASPEHDADEHIYHMGCRYEGCTLHKYVADKTGNIEVTKDANNKFVATEDLTLADGEDFKDYEPFISKTISYSRDIPKGSTWGTLCLPFAIVQSQETECKFYRLTGIDNDNDCITLESYEEGAKIPAGTPVLFKMNKGVQTLSISAQNAELVKEPVAGTNTDVNLVGSFTKIGGKDNQGLDKNDYIIGKDKFWLVSELKDGKGVGIKPMRAYIHPATTSQARAAMLSIGKGDGTTAIDNLNAISNDANAEYYDANGRRTNGLQKGLNIVKRGSKTYKILVK